MLAECLKNDHESSNQIVTSTDDSAIYSLTRRKGPKASCEKSDIEAAMSSSSKKIPERHDLYSEELLTAHQQQEQSPSKSSNQSVTPRNKNNFSHAAKVAQQNTPACFESSGMSHTKNTYRIESIWQWCAQYITQHIVRKIHDPWCANF
jgi:hypothetical protein